MSHDEPLALAINTAMVSKPADHARHDKNWQRTIMPPSAIMRMATEQGHAFTASLKKNGARNRANFAALNLAALDFDDTHIDTVLAHPMAKHASFAYESASSTPENPRCRLVFTLEDALNFDDARQAIQALQHAFRDLEPDTSTKDPVRCWYGAAGKRSMWIGGLLDAETIRSMVESQPKQTMQPQQAAPTTAPTSDKWANAALDRELERVRTAPNGSRNHILFGATCKLLEITNTGALDIATVRQQLTAAATATGLEMHEIAATITSAEQRTQGKTRAPKPLPPSTNCYVPDEPPAWLDNDFTAPPGEIANAVDRMLEQRPARKTTWTTEDLLTAEFPEPTWIVPGMLPTGLAMLAGRPKLGKSWLALQTSIAVGSGGMVFGKQVDQRPVLYFALEDSPRRLQERLQKMRATKNASVEFRTEMLPLANGGAAVLLQAAESKQYGMIVIDTFARAAGRVDQMDLAVTGELMGRIQRTAVDNDVLILMVDHHRKSAGDGDGDPIDDAMGSTGKTAPLDVAIGLYRKRGQKDATLKITGRDIEEQALAIAFDPLTRCWQMMGTADGVRAQSVQAAILNAISEYGGAATTKQLAQFLGKDPGNISRELGELVTNGIVTRGGKDGREVMYSIANQKA